MQLLERSVEELERTINVLENKVKQKSDYVTWNFPSDSISSFNLIYQFGPFLRLTL